MLDRKEIVAAGGRGGSGAVSFLREKFHPNGGPDGGDGGSGGVVVCRAAANVRTLAHLESVRRVAGAPGAPGRSNRCSGASGKRGTVQVPVGTVVWEIEDGERRFLTELTFDGAEAVIAYGGKGGFGNVHFAASWNRTPRIALSGEPGEERAIELEVKSLADVALVGAPNAGKSTLLGAVSRASPKIGDYPFTTIDPNFGVVRVWDRRLVVLDAPGLIEGASEGKGLGLEFLRHCERALALAHLVDGAADDLAAEHRRVRREIEAYGNGLAEKPVVVAVTKMDLPEARRRYEEQRKRLAASSGAPVMAVSAATGEGVAALLERLAALAPEPKSEPLRPPQVPRKPKPARGPFVQRVGREFIVSCPLAERMFDATDVANWRGRTQVHAELVRMGVIDALERAGAGMGDPVYVGRHEMVWH